MTHRSGIVKATNLGVLTYPLPILLKLDLPQEHANNKVANAFVQACDLNSSYAKVGGLCDRNLKLIELAAG